VSFNINNYFKYLCLLSLLGVYILECHAPEQAAISEEIQNINKEAEPEAKKEKEIKEITPISYGNLALPSSQMPGPNYGFGQNINDKGTFLIYEFTDQAKECNGEFIDLVTWITYSPTDTDSILVSVPVEVKLQEDGSRSSGIGDVFVQFEHSFYNRSTHTAYDYASIVANVTFPTGSTKKNPATGLGVASFFFGVAAAHLAIDWYVYSSYGVAAPTSDSADNKPGNLFLYQFGVGHNICPMQHWILFMLVEVSGEYTTRDKVNGVIDCNSGGNVVWLGPTLFASSKHFAIEFGAQMPVSQHLFGTQNQLLSRSDLIFGWTWYF